MAKSAQDTKVEDVLSSVRRLVSEELPRNERPALPEGPGALVLTDAQRIESNAAMRIAGRSLEERIAELEVAVGDTANDDEFEPDGSEDQSLHRPDRIVYTRPPLPEESDAIRRNTLRLSQIALINTGDQEDDSDNDADDSDVPLQFRREGSAALTVDPDEAPMAEDVKETLTAAEVHIFTSPDDEIARIEARLNGEPLPEPVIMPAAPVSEPEPEEAVVATGVAPVDETAEVAEVAEVFETEVVSDVHETLEGSSDASFEADLEEAVAASVEEPTEKQNNTPTAQSTEEAIGESAMEDAVVEILDEEELRPIVARLIREELQGELGERITRNVRKLVRREILRALAARDTE